jgi:uncharacterized protein YcsI (UPF0317 family)
MFTTDNQTALKDELNTMFKEQGAAFTAGYCNMMVQEMLMMLPKRKQKEFLKCVQTFNDCQIVTVKNLMSGMDVEICRGDRGSCCDPSTERYHSM